MIGVVLLVAFSLVMLWPVRPRKDPPVKIIALVLALVLAGCGMLRSAGGKLVDHTAKCATAQAAAVFAELGPVVRPAVVSAWSSGDYSGIEALLKDATADVTGCLLANITTDAVKAIRGAPKTHAQQLDPEAVLAGMRAALTKRFGNAIVFETAAGPL